MVCVFRTEGVGGGWGGAGGAGNISVSLNRTSDCLFIRQFKGRILDPGTQWKCSGLSKTRTFISVHQK